MLSPPSMLKACWAIRDRRLNKPVPLRRGVNAILALCLAKAPAGITPWLRFRPNVFEAFPLSCGCAARDSSLQADGGSVA